MDKKEVFNSGEKGSERVIVTAEDEPSYGNAHHHYAIQTGSVQQRIAFQQGPVQKVGRNGVTEVALLWLLLDRFRSFQTSEFACDENAVSIWLLEQVLLQQQKRTDNRQLRGVEGTEKT